MNCEKIKIFIEKLLRFFYPNTCPLCGRVIRRRCARTARGACSPSGSLSVKPAANPSGAARRNTAWTAAARSMTLTAAGPSMYTGGRPPGPSISSSSTTGASTAGSMPGSWRTGTEPSFRSGASPASFPYHSAERRGGCAASTRRRSWPWSWQRGSASPRTPEALCGSATQNPSGRWIPCCAGRTCGAPLTGRAAPWPASGCSWWTIYTPPAAPWTARPVS